MHHEAQHPSAQNGSSGSVNTLSLLRDESLTSLLLTQGKISFFSTEVSYLTHPIMKVLLDY